MNKYKSGDCVFIHKLKKTGVVISAPSNKSVRVSIGDMQITCLLTEIEPASSSQSNNYKSEKKNILNRNRPKAPTSIDLHGYKSEDAREALLQFMSKAVIAGHKEVTIIHGYGSGIIKKLVHNMLSEMDFVASYRHPISNNAETKVYLY